MNWYFGAGTLSVGRDGSGVVIASGADYDDSTPGLVALNLEGKELWRAQLPSDVDEIERVSLDGSKELLIASTEYGGLFVFTPEGVLLNETRVRGSRTSEDLTVFHAKAGQERDGTWTITVQTSVADERFAIELP